MLGMFGGSDSISATLVVGAFLFGLGIGSHLAGVYADRLTSRRAVVAFALCELGIAAFGAISRWVFYDLFFGELVAVAESRWTIFAMLFLGLLWPTTLMGMSLPFLAKAIVRRIDRSATAIGWLYGLNTIGAGLGAVLAGWWLVGSWGYPPTIWLAALLNGLVGLAALLVAPAMRTDDAQPPRRGADARIGAGVWRWCILMLVSGFIIISLEIVWFRLIGLMLQSNAYTFALVLAVFLLGDGLGIIAGAYWVPRIRDPKAFFIGLQGVVAAYAVGSIWLLYDGFARSQAFRIFVESDAMRDLAANGPTILALTAALVLPPSFLLGLSFPIAQRAVQDDPAVVGQRVGLIQLFNILGNTAGSIVTGLFLLHWLGTSATLRLLAAIGIAFTTVLLVDRWRAMPRPALVGTAVVWALLALLVAGFPDGREFWSRLHHAHPAQTVHFAEDRTGVTLLRVDPNGNGTFFIQGHSQARLPFIDVHGLLGAIGPLVHPDPRRVLLIGVGGAATPYAAGVNPATQTIRAVEIVGSAYDVLDSYASAERGSAVARVRADPRYEWVLGDGRRDLFVAEGRWDVIEADAILPKTSHSGMLYSVEFFRQVQARLADGGIAVQWAPTQRIVDTFTAVFPHVVRVENILLGSDRPVPFDMAAFHARLAEPGVASYLARGGYCCVGIARLSGERVRGEWRPDTARQTADVNTDLFPKDEYYLNR
jgi:spermidine synthase